MKRYRRPARGKEKRILRKDQEIFVTHGEGCVRLSDKGGKRFSPQGETRLMAKDSFDELVKGLSLPHTESGSSIEKGDIPLLQYNPDGSIRKIDICLDRYQRGNSVKMIVEAHVGVFEGCARARKRKRQSVESRLEKAGFRQEQGLWYWKGSDSDFFGNVIYKLPSHQVSYKRG